ncbi:MAG TPA: MBL fold metallo-hydrolase [Acidobacteriota bacterium]|jgi:beta-lactamase superfamily II metal-dependent hydrolase
MKKALVILTAFIVVAANVPAKSPPKRGLDIYFIDVEGGAATLIVTPMGESVLVDTGWKRDDRRDALRIFKAAQAAGLKQIDNLVTTHFHRDHYGGILALSQLIPIRTFYDHGPMTELKEDPQFAQLYADYLKATGGTQKQLRPGDTIPLQSGKKIPISLICLSSARQTLAPPPNAPPNRACADLQPEPEDPSDNAASVGLHLRYGAFDFLDLGDLTRAIEAKLVCPYNVIGQIDLYQVTHHGLKASNLPVLLDSVRPTVAVINNGAKKGGNPEVYDLLKSVATVRDVFQVHRNLDSAEWNNAPAYNISNLGPEEGCAGYGIHVVVAADSKSFVVLNERPGSGALPGKYRVE